MKDKIITVVIPEEMTFSELVLARDSDGDVSFDLDVLERICKANDLPMEIFSDASEANVSGLIVAWYQEHLHKGGNPDPVAEDLIAELVAEEKSGQTVSYQPGRA